MRDKQGADHMNIVLLGPPGAGKGTQASVLCKTLKIPHISTGDMLRRAIRDNTPAGLKVKAIIDQGNLIPDNEIIALVNERLAKPDCAHGYLLDGFPRTIPQAKALESEGKHIDYVIELVLDEEEIVKRISGRRWHPASGRSYNMIYQPPKHDCVDDITGEPLVQRADDKESTVRNRLHVYQKQTEPLIHFYQALAKTSRKPLKFCQVSGEGSVSEITARILEDIGTNTTA